MLNEYATNRLWDIGKSGNNVGEMKLPPNVEGSPLAAFDSTGLVFGISAAMAGDEGNVSFVRYFSLLSKRSPLY